MQINIEKFNEVAEAAKAKTNDKRWRAAIEKAQAGVVSGWWIITPLANCYAITTETGQTYFANGECQCEAYRRNQPCKHRCAARLLDLYNEALASAPAHVDVATSAAISNPKDERAELITDIKATWPRVEPRLPLETELMARFGKNQLEMLDTDMLRRVRLAIAM